MLLILKIIIVLMFAYHAEGKSNTLNTVTTSTEVIGGLLTNTLAEVQFFQYSVPLIFEFDTPKYDQDTLRQLQVSSGALAALFDENNPWVQNLKNQSTNNISTKEKILTTDGQFGYQSPFRNHALKLITPDEEVAELKSRILQKGYKIYRINSRVLTMADPTNGCTSLYDYFSLRDHARAVLEMCQNKRFQTDFINATYFQQLLTEVEAQVIKQNLTLTLPSTQLYYGLPLVECNLGKTNNLVVLHLPLIEKLPAKPILVQIYSPSFAWRSQICSLGVGNTQMALLDIDGIIRSFLPDCNPLTDDLCLITENYEANHLHFLCLKKILTGGTAQDLATACPMYCKETDTSQFIISKTPTSFLITNAPDKSKIICEEVHYIIDNFENIGLLRIELPCDCKIHLSGETILKPQFPCAKGGLKTPTVTRMIPAAWANIGSLHLPGITKQAPTFSSLNEVLNTAARKSKENSFGSTGSGLSDILSWVFTGLSFLMSLISTGLWVYLFYHQFVLSRPIVIREMLEKDAPSSQRRDRAKRGEKESRIPTVDLTQERDTGEGPEGPHEYEPICRLLQPPLHNHQVHSRPQQGYAIRNDAMPQLLPLSTIPLMNRQR